MRNRVLTQVGIAVTVGSFAVGSIAAAAAPVLDQRGGFGASADLAALPEIATDAADGAVVTTETEEVALEPGTVKKNDPNLAKGKEKVVTEGEPGAQVVTYDVTYVGGVEVSRVTSLAVTIEPPTDQVIAVGTRTVPTVGAVSPGTARALGQQMAADMYGWTGDQWSCLSALWQKESGWNPLAHNPSSGAHGIPQALPGSKMASAGDDWYSNAATQIKWGLGYIKGRYGTPCNAWNHSGEKGWY